MTSTERIIWCRGYTAGVTFCGFCAALVDRSFPYVVVFTLWGGWQLYRLMFPKEAA